MKAPSFLVLACVECLRSLEIPFEDLERERLVRWLYDKRWLLSVVSKPGVGKVVMAPLCERCAKLVHRPEVLAAAQEHLENPPKRSG